MNIALAHLTLNFLGGEERLCLSFIEVLKLSNHRVALFTIEKTDWGSVKEFFGKVVKPDDEIYLTSPAMHTKLQKTLTATLAYANYLKGLIKLSSNEKYQLVINTFGDLVNCLADISYIHFPIKATLDYSQTPVFASPFKWKIYCKMYNLITLLLDNVRPSFLLTNSKFTQQIVRKYLKRDALVLHPPVDVSAYTNKKAKRENFVLTVAKFSPKRHLHKVPLIAKNAKNAKFIIIGQADEYSFETIDDLRRIISKCGVEDKVTLMPNVSRSTLIDLLSRAKAYLHVMPYDHFGISVVEAMAAGCVPIVHRSGGPWLDILDQQQGKSGFCYTTPNEAAHFIDYVMTDESLRNEVSHRAQERSLMYDKSVFRESLIEVVNELASYNRRFH